LMGKDHGKGKTVYLRDGRAPIPNSEITSRVMSANKGKDTKPEMILRRSLREAGLPGYRLHWKGAPGRPDIAYPGHRVAIFVHGDFWHRCPVCNLPLPKTHTEFWEQKLERNVQRDARKVAELEAAGWKVFVCWEHEIREDPSICAERIRTYIESKKLTKLAGHSRSKQ
jgi:DNA mismatch endonuclease (patch repair protein)